MKTITYNPETHVLVPREPEWFVQYTSSWDHFKHMGKAWIGRFYRSAIAAAPQPEPVESCDTCKNNGGTRGVCQNESCAYEPKTKPVDVEPVAYAYYSEKYKKPMLEFSLNARGYEGEWRKVPLYTTHQPDRTAELEAALNVAMSALNRAADKFHDYAEIHAAKEASPENDVKVERNLALAADMDKALAKINEVLKP